MAARAPAERDMEAALLMPGMSAQPGLIDPQRRFELLQAGLDLINQGLSVADSDMRLVAWNRAFFEMLEFPESLAYVGAPFDAFIRYNAERGEYGPGDIEQQVAVRVAAASTMKAHRIERVRPNGRVIEIRREPLPGRRLISVYTDITEQRNHEAALQARLRE